MSASGRAARAGLFAYAGCLLVEPGLGFWSRHLIARVRESDEGFSSIEKQLDLLGYGYLALGVGAAVALFAVTRAPRTARVLRVATQAAVFASLAAVVEIAQHVFLRMLMSGAIARTDHVLKVFGAGIVLADIAAKALVVVVAVRVGRVAPSRATTPLAIASLLGIGATLAFYVATLTLRPEAISPAVANLQNLLYDASAVLLAATAIQAGLGVSRVRDDVPTTDALSPSAASEALSPQWRSAADGIGLYLGGAAARVVCALLGYAMMAGGAGNTGTPDLRGMHDSVFAVSIASGIASVTMLAAVWRITRAPAESGGPGPAMITLCLMIMGFVLDLVTTSITLSALGGSLSAAFFAMDALPLLAGGAVLLGIGAGVALLRSFGNMAHALGAEELTSRAKGTATLLVVTGALAGLAVLVLTHLPAELLALVAVVLLPLAMAALVQFLRVAVPLRRLIRDRLGMEEA